MPNKKSSGQKIDDAVAKSFNFELTIADIARRSERRAWWVASCAIVIALILAGGYFYMLPLKEKVPYIVMADAYTGTSTVARLTEDFTNRQISTSEAINRSNVAHFVMARESYDVAMINLHDWATVLTMSSPGVATTYRNLYSTSNPDSLYKVYGKDRAIRVKILSIVLIGGGAGNTPKGATVRFQRSVYNKQTGAAQPLDNKIATMEFAYKANLKMDDQNRVENPLGFQVMDYRVDNDYDSTPPDEVLGASAPSTGAQQMNQSGSTPASNASAGEVPQTNLVPQSPIPEQGAPNTPSSGPAAIGPSTAPAPLSRSTANEGGRR